MGRKAYKTKFYFNYTNDFVEHYNNQSEEMKNFCEDLGQSHGYSGMNMFYIFFNMYWSCREVKIPFPAVVKG